MTNNETLPDLDRGHLAERVRAWRQTLAPQRDRLCSHLRMAGLAAEAERLKRGDDPDVVADGMVRL